MSRRLGSFGVQHRPNSFIAWGLILFALGRIVALRCARWRGLLLCGRRARISDDEAERVLHEIYLRSSLSGEDFGNVKTTVNRVRQRMDFSGDLRLGGPTIGSLAKEFLRRAPSSTAV